RRIEGERFFHRCERKQLKYVVLNDVSGSADSVVVPGATTDSDVLSHADLDVVNVVRVPDRLKHLVRETESQNVLDRFLTQVVVDTEHRVGRKDRFDDGVELTCGFEVRPEWFLNDNPSPLAVLRLGHSGAAELLRDFGEGFGWDREV